MAEAQKPKSGWLNVAVDYGPLVVFLAIYKFYSPAEPSPIAEVSAVVKGTGTFIVAALIALGFSKFVLGKVSPMLWLSTVLIVVFGGLTVFLGDPVFVQIKPTLIYAIFGLLLLGGWLKGKSLLKILLEAAFDGVDEAGWLKLSRNWGIFFLALAGINEVLRATLSFESWLWAKFWVFLPLTFLFTFTQIPMLLKHGLALEDTDDVVKDEPPTA